MIIDNIINKISKFFTRERRIIFFSVFIVGMLVHLSLYANDLLAYDAYWHYGSFLAKGWEVSLGRFIIPFIDLFRGTIVTSVLTTSISIATISFASIFLSELLHIKKLYLKILIGILLIVTPTFSLTLMYAYTSNAYTFALLFSILTVYFLDKKSNLKNTIFTIICVIMTLGCYQAYLCVITALFFIVYILKIFDKKLSVKQILTKFVRDICILLLGLISYYICYIVMVNLLHLSITSYSGGNSVLSMNTIQNIIFSIKNAYMSFYQFYFTDNILTNLSWYRNIIYIIMFLLILINFIIIIINNKIYKVPLKLLILIVLLLLFPISACSIELIAQSRDINLLMASSLYIPIILLFKQTELLNVNKINNLIHILSILIASILIWTYILSDNATYDATKLYNKQMYSIGNRILQDISKNDKITSDTPIVILGKMDFSIQNDTLLKLTNFDVSNINIWTWQIFLQDELGIGRNICTFEEYNSIFDLEEYIQMPIYPDPDSIKIINGIAVVKLNY